jgi:hypothetical protein
MNRISYIVIVLLVIVIILMRSCSNINNKETFYTKTDTIYKQTIDTVIKNVRVIGIKYVNIKEPIFTSVDTCNKEYNRQTVYRDTIKLDSIGNIILLDTVFQNKLGKRTVFKDYRIPIVTKTVTINKTQQPKRQLYLGGNLFGDERRLQTINTGLLYKDKKDRVYMVNIGVNFDGTVTYGLGTYFKIKIK